MSPIFTLADPSEAAQRQRTPSWTRKTQGPAVPDPGHLSCHLSPTEDAVVDLAAQEVVTMFEAIHWRCDGGRGSGTEA